MKKTLVLIALAGAPLLLAAPAAEAHDRGARNDYHAHAYHAGGMPRWLRQRHGFRKWYRLSPLRVNVRLDWHELYTIYRWEQRYTHHRRAHHYAHAHDRGFRYYKRYWKHGDRRAHGKRYGDRRKFSNDRDYRPHRSKKDGRRDDHRRRDSRRH
jgi:hypothetical protein